MKRKELHCKLFFFLFTQRGWRLWIESVLLTVRTLRDVYNFLGLTLQDCCAYMGKKRRKLTNEKRRNDEKGDFAWNGNICVLGVMAFIIHYCYTLYALQQCILYVFCHSTLSFQPMNTAVCVELLNVGQLACNLTGKTYSIWHNKTKDEAFGETKPFNQPIHICRHYLSACARKEAFIQCYYAKQPPVASKD